MRGSDCHGGRRRARRRRSDPCLQTHTNTSVLPPVLYHRAVSPAGPQRGETNRGYKFKSVCVIADDYICLKGAS